MSDFSPCYWQKVPFYKKFLKDEFCLVGTCNLDRLGTEPVVVWFLEAEAEGMQNIFSIGSLVEVLDLNRS